jgi:hypothetical protein
LDTGTVDCEYDKKARPAGQRNERRGRGAAQGAPRRLAVSKSDILAALDDQFTEISNQLAAQVIRTAQIQAEIEAHHRETAELREQLQRVHALVKQLVGKH